MGNQPLLEVRGLTKHFPTGGYFNHKSVKALNNATFSIESGEVVSLVGESGSGKSTAARLIARLIPATAGEIIFDGNDVLRTEQRGASRKYRSEVQMIFQDPFASLNQSHTIGHHLERPLKIHGMVNNENIEARIHELLETVGLTPAADVANRFPYELSGGQRQRVAIARALAVEPRLILADEPISMLDVSIRAGILNLMQKLKEEQDIGFLYITHDLASARYIGDKTIVMYAGHMVEGGDSTELMENPIHPYTRLLKSAVPDPASGFAKKNHGNHREAFALDNLPDDDPFVKLCSGELNGTGENLKRKWVSDTHWVLCHMPTK